MNIPTRPVQPASGMTAAEDIPRGMPPLHGNDVPPNRHMGRRGAETLDYTCRQA